MLLISENFSKGETTFSRGGPLGGESQILGLYIQISNKYGDLFKFVAG